MKPIGSCCLFVGQIVELAIVISIHEWKWYLLYLRIEVNNLCNIIDVTFVICKFFKVISACKDNCIWTLGNRGD